ncbi:MAG: ABC transporter permease [Gaiellaceae bacterium]
MTVYADLYTYRDLFVNLWRRDLQVRYRGSILGLFWTFLNPLVLVGVYTLVFSVLWKAFAIEHYALFVCTGLVVWTFFSTVMTTASASLISQAQLVQQVRFPRQLLPLSVTAAGIVTLLAMLAVVLALNLSFIPETRSTFWLALPMLVPLVAFTGALAIIAASLTVLFRDIEHLIQTALLPWFFLTPIFYTFDALPGVEGHPNIVNILYWGNPITPALSAVRDPLFFGTLTRPSDAIYSVVAALVALTAAALVFRRVDDQLAAQL